MDSDRHAPTQPTEPTGLIEPRRLLGTHPEGWRFVLPAVALATALAFWQPLVAAVVAAFALFAAWFFRDPRRQPPDPADDRAIVIVSPCDGRVCAITETEAGTRISVFMTVFNVHVNRAPVSGTVTGITYTPGRFLNASFDKASERNERNAVAIRLVDGRELVVTQIAGLVARRIVCHARVGDDLRTGERFGLIRFGSRLDVTLPPDSKPAVAIGDRVRAGESVVARTV